MKISSMLSRRWIVASLLVPFVGAPVTVYGALDDVVLLWGKNSETKAYDSKASVPGTMVVIPSAEKACELAEEFLESNLDFMLENVPVDVLNDLGIEGPGLPEALEGPKCKKKGKADPDFFLIFASCSMIMGSGDYYMRWTVPPFASEPHMLVLDTSAGEGKNIRLKTALEAAHETGVPLGNLRNAESYPTKETKTVTLEVSPEARGFVAQEYSAQQYKFSYKGELMLPGTDMGPLLGDLGSIKSNGDAWIVPDAPGADVVGAFYRNFDEHVVPSAGADTLLGGMMRQMAGLASHGIPVRTTQKTDVTGAWQAYRAGQTSTSTIERIMVLPGRAPEKCGPTIVPEGIVVTDLGAEMDAASAEGNAQLEQAMSEMAQAMEQMSPEQREMMKALGFGGGQQMPVAKPADQTAGAAAANTVTERTSPSSAELTTDNLTQTAQNHLQALGYDPGNTDGDVSTETTLAVLQFQADKGLAVTGEVTPQLVESLSAEVDK